MGFNADVLQDDQLVIALGFLEGSFQQFPGIHPVTGEEFLIGFHHAGGCVTQPLAIRVVAGPLQQGPNGGFRVGAARTALQRGLFANILRVVAFRWIHGRLPFSAALPCGAGLVQPDGLMRTVE